MTGVVEGLGLRREAMARAAAMPEMMAAGLAVALAREGMPFRKAHALVGSLVAEAQRSGTRSRRRRRACSQRPPRWRPASARSSIPEEAVRAKAAPGGTAPQAVREALRLARERVRAGLTPP